MYGWASTILNTTPFICCGGAIRSDAHDVGGIPSQCVTCWAIVNVAETIFDTTCGLVIFCNTCGIQAISYASILCVIHARWAWVMAAELQRIAAGVTVRVDTLVP